MCNPLVFISHSSHDTKYANNICAVLESHGVKCWIAPRDIKPGEAYPSEITRGIKDSTTFLVILTKDSINSPHVNTETDIAFNNDKQIVPFFIDKVELDDSMSYYLARKQWILGYENYSEAIESLLGCISKIRNSNQQEQLINETIHILSTQKEKVSKDISLNNPNKQKSFLRDNTKSQLYFISTISIISLVFLPPLGIIMIVLLWLLYPEEVRYILHKHKKQIIIIASIIIGLIILLLIYLMLR